MIYIGRRVSSQAQIGRFHAALLMMLLNALNLKFSSFSDLDSVNSFWPEI